MIEIVNPVDTAEGEASIELQNLILLTWPDIKSNNSHDIKILPSVKCYGEKREDIDILVFGIFDDPLPTIFIRNKLVRVNNFCFLVEVKDHDLGKVRFTGTKVDVNYKNNWHDATRQNFEQRNSFLDYLKRKSIKPPFVTNLIWMRNIPISELPEEPHNILGSTSGWEDFLQKIKFSKSQEIGVSTLDKKDELAKAISVFTNKLQPSRLDRQRMERISEQTLTGQQYAEKLGQQLLIFQGRGGTGKTVRLIRLAHDMYQRQQARLLILTYHKALVSDIRRLFSLMNIRDGIGEKGIKIQTVYSFMYQLFESLGIITSPCFDFLEHYEDYKAKFLELMPAIQTEDIYKLKRQNNHLLDWDYILIDESQDWPKDERDILFSIYDYRCFVLANGVAQIARKQELTNWRENINKENSQIVTLNQIVRMKKNLSLFVKDFSRCMGLASHDIQPYRFAEGGEVIIIEGSYSKDPQIHRDLLSKNVEDGNELVDMLFCMPPSLVRKNGTKTYSVVGEQFKKMGYKVWDGVEDDIRLGYPTDLEQLRLIQYDSCRGLEGWIVVNLELNKFYDYKKSSYLSSRSTTSEGDFSLDTKELAAREYAARWMMIPLTRAIDTLVIQVNSSDHEITKILHQLANKYQDFIDWRKVQ